MTLAGDAARLIESDLPQVRQQQGMRVCQRVDDAVAQRDQARASVHLAEAEIRNARLNLDYTTVVAPASGVTALQSPPVGTLIQAQQTLLTTITRLDPAYVMFSFTDTEAQDFRELNQRRAKPIVAEDLTVELHYSNGAIYPHTGKIDQAAQRVDLRHAPLEEPEAQPDDLLVDQGERVEQPAERDRALPGAAVEDDVDRVPFEPLDVLLQRVHRAEAASGPGRERPPPRAGRCGRSG